MKIAYISDTHCDFYINSKATIDEMKMFIKLYLPETPEADIAIVAGDISHHNQQSINFLIALKEFYPRIACVGGNHDLYLINNDQRYDYNYNSFKKHAEFKTLCEDNDILYLDGTTITIDGITIGGCMGWYEIGSTYDWLEFMNDGHYILRYKPAPLAYSSKECTFSPNQLFKEETAKIPECDVLITHVCQALHLTKNPNPRYNDDQYNEYYEADNIHILKEKNIKHHIFGHSHTIAEFEIDGIQFYSNCLGYPKENLAKGFKILELKAQYESN